MCCSSWGRKESDMAEGQNCPERNKTNQSGVSRPSFQPARPLPAAAGPDDPAKLRRDRALRGAGVLAPSTAAGRWVGESWPAGLRILPVI